MSFILLPESYLLQIISQLEKKLGPEETARLQALATISDVGKRQELVEALEVHAPGIGQQFSAWSQVAGTTAHIFRLPCLQSDWPVRMSAGLKAAAKAAAKEDKKMPPSLTEDQATEYFGKEERTKTRIIRAAISKMASGSPVLEATVMLKKYVGIWNVDTYNYYPKTINVEIRIRGDMKEPVAQVYGAASDAKQALLALVDCVLSGVPRRGGRTHEYYSIVAVPEHSVSSTEGKIGLVPTGLDGDNATGTGDWEKQYLRNKSDGERMKPLDLSDASLKKQYAAHNDRRFYNFDFNHTGKYPHAELHEVALHYPGTPSHPFYLSTRRRLSHTAMNYLITCLCQLVGHL